MYVEERLDRWKQAAEILRRQGEERAAAKSPNARRLQAEHTRDELLEQLHALEEGPLADSARILAQHGQGGSIYFATGHEGTYRFTPNGFVINDTTPTTVAKMVTQLDIGLFNSGGKRLMKRLEAIAQRSLNPK